MKSVIDWNEIVPLLKKELRDTLMLEAVLILSSGNRSRPGKYLTVRAPRGNGGIRNWKAQGDGSTLNGKGRRYRINKTVERQPTRGKIGNVWRKLLDSKNDTITYEGLASLCKGANAQTAALICHLWERRFIDVEAKKFIEAIPGK